MNYRSIALFAAVAPYNDDQRIGRGGNERGNRQKIGARARKKSDRRIRGCADAKTDTFRIVGQSNNLFRANPFKDFQPGLQLIAISGFAFQITGKASHQHIISLRTKELRRRSHGYRGEKQKQASQSKVAKRTSEARVPQISRNHSTAIKITAHNLL